MPATRLKIGGTLASDAQLAGWLDDLLNGANGLQYRRAALTTAGQDIFDISGVFNGPGQVLDGFLLSITDTASAAASRAMRVRVGVTDILTLTKAGTLTAPTLIATTELTLPTNAPGAPSAGDLYRVADTIRYRDSGNVERLLLNAADNLANLGNAATARSNLGLALLIPGTNLIEQYNGTAAQTFRLYRSRVDGSNLGYTALTQDATTGFIIDSVTTGSVGAPTNLLAVRANGGANVLTVQTTGATLAGFIQITEQTAPAAGAANTARIHAFDDTAGNTIPGAMDSAGKVRTMGRLGPMTLAQLNAYPTTTLIVGVTEAHVTDGPAPGVHRWTASGWAADVVNQVLDVVSQSATGTALSGACLFGGIRIRSGTPTLTVYDATSATGTPIQTITAGSATGGPLLNGYYPWATLGGFRPNTTGVHVVLSGTGTWDTVATPA